MKTVLLENSGGRRDACANAFYSYGKDPFTQLVDRISECNDTNLKNIHLKRTGSDYLYGSVKKINKDFCHHATDKPAKLVFKCSVPLLTDSSFIFQTEISQDDVIESANAAQPLAQRLADANIGHMTGKLAEAWVECGLEGQEGGV